MNHIANSDRALYEADEHAWMLRQIDALRDGRLEDLDRESLAEYLTDMTIGNWRELQSRLIVLIGHLLKLRFQPGRHGASWTATIRTQQRDIELLLESLPSLAAKREEVLAKAYPRAVRLAASETGLPSATLPPDSPWSVDEALAFTPPAPLAPLRYRRKP